MRSWVAIFFLFLGLCCSPVIAGVVEDAEEEMKKLKQQQRESGQSVSEPELTPIFPPADSQGSSRVSSDAPEKDTASRRNPLGSQSASSRKTGPAVKDPQEKKQQVRRVRKRDASDRLLSIVGILLFLLLIVAGALYGKRSDSQT